MKVKVGSGAVIQAQALDFGDKGLLKTEDLCVVERVGVGRQGCTLRQGIETGEKTDASIECMIAYMGVAFGSQQLEGKKGEEIVQGRNMLVGGQSCLSHHLIQLQLGHEGSKEENSRGIRPEVHGTSEVQGFCSLGHRGSLDGGADFQPCPSRELGKSLFCQDTLNGPHGDVLVFFAQQLGNIPRGQSLLPPGDDLATYLPGHLSCAPAISRGFGEIQFSVAELMPQDPEIAGGVAEPFRHDAIRLAIDKRRPEGFVSSLPVRSRPGKKIGILHVSMIHYGAQLGCLFPALFCVHTMLNFFHWTSPIRFILSNRPLVSFLANYTTINLARILAWSTKLH